MFYYKPPAITQPVSTQHTSNGSRSLRFSRKSSTSSSLIVLTKGSPPPMSLRTTTLSISSPKTTINSCFLNPSRRISASTERELVAFQSCAPLRRRRPLCRHNLRLSSFHSTLPHPPTEPVSSIASSETRSSRTSGSRRWPVWVKELETSESLLFKS